jgi:hypothetical protein
MATELLEYAFVAVALFYPISKLIKRDLQEQNGPASDEPVEEPEPAVQVLNIENMSPSQKVQVTMARIDETENMLFSENKLNDFRRCLVTAQQLKSATDNAYRTERVALGRAISWLEKPLVARGQSDTGSGPCRRDADEINAQIVSLMKAVWRATGSDRTSLSDENCESTIDPNAVNEDHHHRRQTGTGCRDDDDDDDDGRDGSRRPSAREVITVENVLEFGRWIRLQVENRWPELIRCASDAMKVWFAVFMTVRYAALRPERLKSATDAIQKLPEKCLTVRAVLDHGNDATTMDFRLFPFGPHCCCVNDWWSLRSDRQRVADGCE